MPLYEYECESCRHRFERLQKFSDPPVETCPVCDQPVRRLISSSAIQFKGSGWYVTDYARKGQPGDEKAAPDGDKAAPEKGKPAEKSGEKSTETSTAPAPAGAKPSDTSTSKTAASKPTPSSEKSS